MKILVFVFSLVCFFGCAWFQENLSSEQAQCLAMCGFDEAVDLCVNGPSIPASISEIIACVDNCFSAEIPESVQINLRDLRMCSITNKARNQK
jgi:hypothetical protein